MLSILGKLYVPRTLGSGVPDSKLYSNRPYIGSALIGCWITDPLNYFLGRRGTLFWCGIFCTLSVIGSGFAQTWPQLLVRSLFFHAFNKLTNVLQVCRLLLGLGMGPKATTSPVFSAENTPASIRGGLVMCWQLWVRIFIPLFLYCHHAQAQIFRLLSASSLDFLPILLLKGLVKLRGVFNLALPSFPPFLWLSGSTSAQVRLIYLLFQS